MGVKPITLHVSTLFDGLNTELQETCGELHVGSYVTYILFVSRKTFLHVLLKHDTEQEGCTPTRV